MKITLSNDKQRLYTTEPVGGFGLYELTSSPDPAVDRYWLIAVVPADEFLTAEKWLCGANIAELDLVGYTGKIPDDAMGEIGVARHAA